MSSAGLWTTLASSQSLFIVHSYRWCEFDCLVKFFKYNSSMHCYDSKHKVHQLFLSYIFDLRMLDCSPVIYLKDLHYFCLSVHCKALKAEHLMYIWINVNCTVYLPLYEKTRTNASTAGFSLFRYADTAIFSQKQHFMLLSFVYQNI